MEADVWVSDKLGGRPFSGLERVVRLDMPVHYLKPRRYWVNLLAYTSSGVVIQQTYPRAL